MLYSRTLSPGRCPHFISFPSPQGRAPIRIALIAALPMLALLSSACSRAQSPYRNWERIERKSWSRDGLIQEGIASWYDESELTAMGTRFDPEEMTAAHKTLPFGTLVRVTRLDTWDSVVVQINDRGPFIEGRVIDLARRPARQLHLLDQGLAPCRVEVLRRPSS